MNNELVFDVETTIKNKGNPYNKDNRVCYWGYLSRNGPEIWTVPPITDLESSLVIGFNLKFDLTWAKRYDILLPVDIWDCQLAHFLLTGQAESYPSLNGVCEFYGLEHKLSIIEEEYWSKGIDTPDIPQEIMKEYLTQDLRLTYQVYQKQSEDFKSNPQLYKLFKLQCEDLLTLIEMEWNGLVVDVASCKEKEKECEEQIKRIDAELLEFTGEAPVNWDSNDHCSAVLYGGTIVYEDRVPIGVYKSGAKEGQTRYKKIKYEYQFPRLVDPPKGSELQKEGYFSTDEDTLRSCGGSRKVKKLIDNLLTRSKLEKLRGTYYKGIPARIVESNSFDGTLHGQFNQCVARTGRLSSSKPNLQNFPPEMNKLMVSRYE